MSKRFTLILCLLFASLFCLGGCGGGGSSQSDPVQVAPTEDSIQLGNGVEVVRRDDLESSDKDDIGKVASLVDPSYRLTTGGTIVYNPTKSSSVAGKQETSEWSLEVTVKVEDPSPDKTYVIVAKVDGKWQIVETRNSLTVTSDINFSIRGTVAGEPVIIDGKNYSSLSIAVLETYDSDTPKGWDPSNKTPMNYNGPWGLESKAKATVKSSQYSSNIDYSISGTATLREDSSGFVWADNGTGTAVVTTGDQTVTVTYPLVAWLPLGQKEALNNSIIMTFDNVYEANTPENSVNWEFNQVIKIYMLPPDRIYFVSRYNSTYKIDSETYTFTYNETGEASRK